MTRKSFKSVVGFVVVIFSVLLTLHIYYSDYDLRSYQIKFVASKDKPKKSFDIGELVKVHDNSTKYNKKKCAVLVPMRNAFEELITFLPKLSEFLTNHEIPFHIFIIHQIDRFRFNRGSLLNVGFLYVQNRFDYVILHDIDIYPINSNVSYEYPGDDQVYHQIPYYLHPNLAVNYEDYLGSIVAVPNEIFNLVDGISNDFWGWGGEDDDFATVLRYHQVHIERPSASLGDRYNTFVHIHDDIKRPRDVESCNGQNRENFTSRAENSGLNSTKYQIKSIQNFIIDESQATLINVKLNCDIEKTPWCECT